MVKHFLLHNTTRDFQNFYSNLDCYFFIRFSSNLFNPLLGQRPPPTYSMLGSLTPTVSQSGLVWKVQDTIALRNPIALGSEKLTKGSQTGKIKERSPAQASGSNARLSSEPRDRQSHSTSCERLRRMTAATLNHWMMG